MPELTQKLRRRAADRELARPRFEDLPDVLTPKDVMRFLPIGRNAVYELIQSGKLESIRPASRSILVTKAALGKYLALNGEADGRPRAGKDSSNP